MGRGLLIAEPRQDNLIAEALASTFGAPVDRVRVVDDALAEPAQSLVGIGILVERRPMRSAARLALDVYLVDDRVEQRAGSVPDTERVQQLARYLSTSILTDDGDLDPSTYLRVAPDGEVGRVHLDDERLDDGMVAVLQPDTSRAGAP